MCTAVINGVAVPHTVVDGGSSTNILNAEWMSKLGITEKDFRACPIAFKGAAQEKLPVLGVWENAKVSVTGLLVTIAFTVVWMHGHGYPALLEQPWLELVKGHHDWETSQIQMGPPERRITLKLDGSQRVSIDSSSSRAMDSESDSEVESDKEVELEESNDAYYVNFADIARGAHMEMIHHISTSDCQTWSVAEENAPPSEETEPLTFFTATEEKRTVQVGKSLTRLEKQELEQLLMEFGYLFIGAHKDMPRTTIAQHEIHLKEGRKPKAHKLCCIKPQHMAAVKEEIDKLLATGFIIPVEHSDWVSPLVIVLKKSGKVRVCIDFRDVNAATLKNRYPLSFIDLLLDAVAGKEIYSFCDGYGGFHQIPMHPDSELKTTFITP